MIAHSIQQDLLWQEYYQHSALDRLLGVIGELDISDLVRKIRQFRNHGGRLDWPIESMLYSFFAVKILGHNSIESFRRELERNPSLMKALGFPMRPVRGSRNHLDPCDTRYRVPEASCFSRFKAMLEDIDEKTGAVRELMAAQVQGIARKIEDFGTHVGYDGKAIESHSTGSRLPEKGKTSDPDASWGTHSNYVTTENGRERKVTKRWFGYKLHVLSDVDYELPIDFRVTTATGAEGRNCARMLDDLKESSLGRRTRSFVADRGLDDNALHRKCYDTGILSVIPGRHLWQEDNAHPGQLSKPTRLLDPGRYDTMLKTEHGDLYCRCPASGEIRSMHYQGYEKDWNTVKWACPATAYDYTCKGREECRRLGGIRQGAKSRIVRMTVDPDHLRNVNVLPPATPKWKKAYAKRSATERIFSRCDGNFMMDDLPVRGIKTVTFHITVSLTAMLAAANFAIDSGRREQMRSIVRNLAA